MSDLNDMKFKSLSDDEELERLLESIRRDIGEASPEPAYSKRPAEAKKPEPAAAEAPAAAPAAEEFQFILRTGIPDGQPQRKAVQLGIGQKLGTRGPRRILGGNDQEGLGHRMGYPVHRDLPLLHGLQQRRLGAAGGPVELIGQEEIA